MSQDNCAFAQAYTPTRAKRFWKWAGYRYHHTESTPETDLMPGWAKSNTVFVFDFADRLRLLLTGRLYVDTTIHADAKVSNVVCFASFEIGHPGDGRFIGTKP